MLLMPYAPPVGGRPLRWLPAKCCAFMEFLRTKFHLRRADALGWFLAVAA
jgi:hypothetical protein